MVKRCIYVTLLVSIIALQASSSLAQGVVSRVLLESSVSEPEKSWWQSMFLYLSGKSDVRYRPAIGATFNVVSSAYAPSPYQTDATPCITASGTRVRDGVVATNFLPIGTIVSIRDKKYIVEDRMNARYKGYYMDIWFPSTSEALEFGRKKLEITIVAYGKAGDALQEPVATPAPVIEEQKSFWRSVADSMYLFGQLIATRTFSNKNKYDVDCFIE